MHVLFNMEDPSSIPQEISEDAVKAADSFVDLCLQHAAYLGGKGNLQEAIDDISKGDYSSTFIQCRGDLNNDYFLSFSSWFK